MKQTQKQAVLDYLETGHTLTRTQAQCLLDIANLSAVISDLRKSGNKIDSISIGGGNVTYELDDNQPYEREFYEFLKGYGGLDWYIEARQDNLPDGVEFCLPKKEVQYLGAAFIWSDAGAKKRKYFDCLNDLWLTKLKTLKAS